MCYEGGREVCYEGCAMREGRRCAMRGGKEVCYEGGRGCAMREGGVLFRRGGWFEDEWACPGGR